MTSGSQLDVTKKRFQCPQIIHPQKRLYKDITVVITVGQARNKPCNCQDLEVLC